MAIQPCSEPRALNRSTPAAKPVLLMSVSIGWAIRNFFQTGIVEELRAHFDVRVLATPRAAEHLRELGCGCGIAVHPIDVGKEPFLWKLFRQARKKAYLEGRASATEAIWEKYSPRPWHQKAGSRLIKAALRLGHGQGLYGALERLDLKVNVDRRFAALFPRREPAIYFATHATTYFEECLLRNALASGLPVAFMILSWDHLSSKVFLNRHLDTILVWNPHTRRELLQTYPWYRPEQIKVVGIPQYDGYARPPDLSYGDWCRKYGLDPRRRTILFSTMPQSRHDQQHIILEALLREIDTGKKLPPDLQVLIKCHPFDTFPGYAVLTEKYHAGIHRSGLSERQDQEDWSPQASEIEASRDALYFCSLNINIFSTVTIEAAYFDKPIVHIAFDPQPVAGRIPCHEYYNWDHFRPIVQKGATLFARSYEELFDAIDCSLRDPGRLREQRQDLVRTFIGRRVGTASSAVVEELVGMQRRLFPGRPS
jgi:hypothetical protein